MINNNKKYLVLIRSRKMIRKSNLKSKNKLKRLTNKKKSNLNLNKSKNPRISKIGLRDKNLRK